MEKITRKDLNRGSHNSGVDEVPLKTERFTLLKELQKHLLFECHSVLIDAVTVQRHPFPPVNLSYNVGKTLQSMIVIPLWPCWWICLTAATPDCCREKGKKPHIK